MAERTAKLGPGGHRPGVAYWLPTWVRLSRRRRILDNRSRGRWPRRIVRFVNGSIGRGNCPTRQRRRRRRLDHAELDISWQLQRVRGQLLHRATKTEASDATLPLPGICVTALRMRQKNQDAARAAADQWPETGLVFTTLAGTSCATSTGVSRLAVPGPGSVVSPSTTPGIRAPPCSPRSTFIPGWPYGYSVTLRST
jgi:hypothetical protein